METHRGKRRAFPPFMWWLINDSQGASKPSLPRWINRYVARRDTRLHPSTALSLCLCVSLILPVTVRPMSTNMLLIWDDWSLCVPHWVFFWPLQFDGWLENSVDHTLQFQANLGHLKFTSLPIGNRLTPFWIAIKATFSFGRTFVIFGLHIHTWVLLIVL